MWLSSLRRELLLRDASSRRSSSDRVESSIDRRSLVVVVDDHRERIDDLDSQSNRDGPIKSVVDVERSRDRPREIDEPGDKIALNDDSLLMPISERGSKS